MTVRTHGELEQATFGGIAAVYVRGVDPSETMDIVCEAINYPDTFVAHNLQTTLKMDQPKLWRALNQAWQAGTLQKATDSKGGIDTQWRPTPALHTLAHLHNRWHLEIIHNETARDHRKIAMGAVAIFAAANELDPVPLDELAQQTDRHRDNILHLGLCGYAAVSGLTRLIKRERRRLTQWHVRKLSAPRRYFIHSVSEWRTGWAP